MAADLHIHTTASDGILTPSAVCKLAKSLKLDAIAITDHDTTGGIMEAVTAGAQLALDVIPGIELSTESEQREFHILGYYIETANAEFEKSLAQLRITRYTRAQQMITKLNELGMNLNLADVETIAGGKTNIGRAHIARLLQQKGYVGSLPEAFAKYIGIGCPAYISRKKMSPRDAVRLIRLAKGIPVLAHPAAKIPDCLIKQLVAVGLCGIEVYHPDHTAAMQAHYRQFAEMNSLLITGGSDFHSPSDFVGNRRIENSRNLGACTIPYAAVTKIREVKQRIFML